MRLSCADEQRRVGWIIFIVSFTQTHNFHVHEIVKLPHRPPGRSSGVWTWKWSLKKNSVLLVNSILARLWLVLKCPRSCKHGGDLTDLSGCRDSYRGIFHPKKKKKLNQKQELRVVHSSESVTLGVKYVDEDRGTKNIISGKHKSRLIFLCHSLNSVATQSIARVKECFCRVARCHRHHHHRVWCIGRLSFLLWKYRSRWKWEDFMK